MTPIQQNRAPCTCETCSRSPRANQLARWLPTLVTLVARALELWQRWGGSGN